MKKPRAQFSVRQLMIAVAIIGGVLGLGVASYRGLQALEAWGGVIHMRSVTRSLAGWEREYSVVRNWQEAERAIGMLEYSSTYYVPMEGYRSDPKTEAVLARQRTKTLEAIATGLRQYTGANLGVNASLRRAWAAQQAPIREGDGPSPGPGVEPGPPPDEAP